MICSGTALSASQERKGVSVEYLGTNNTLIRIADDAKYLLLPIHFHKLNLPFHLLILFLALTMEFQMLYIDSLNASLLS